MLIMILLSRPGHSFPVVRIWQPDKIAHILLFGMQMLLLWLAFELPRPVFASSVRALGTASLCTVAFGVLSEVYQEVATTRMLDPYDMAANSTGVALAFVCVLLLKPERILRYVRLLFRVK
jgi:hypothetical protein